MFLRIRIGWIHLIAVTPVLLILAACASGPRIQKINAFGAAVTSVSDHWATVRQLNRTSSQIKADLGGLETYLARHDISNFTIDNTPENPISDSLLKVRADALNALQGYGTALATLKTTDTSNVTAAVDGLVGSVGDFAALAGVSFTSIPIVGPATKLIGTGVGLMVEQANEQVIINEVARAHPAVVELGILLDDETKDIGAFLSLKLRSIDADFRQFLKRVRKNSPTNIADASDFSAMRSEYYLAINEIRALKGELGKVKNTRRAISKMVDAHASLKEVNPDNEALLKFLDAANNI